jgi:DNA polymerase-1
MADDTLYLIDGSSYVFRAFHALPPLTAPDGTPTGALYGVVNMIRRLLREHSPQHLAVVFDAPGKTFRHDSYSEYKANRPPMPDALRPQIQPLHDLVDALGLPRLVIEGVEADDVIATLTKQARRKGLSVMISSGDKDLAQLVEEGVTLVNTMSNTELDVAGVEQKFGVPPERITDYLALIGDSSDNVPGVPKVGPKTAAKWLEKYGSLDAIIEHADDFGGKIGDYLRESLDQLPLSKQLVELKEDVDLPLGIDELGPGEQDQDSLRQMYQRYGFNSWLEEVGGGDGETDDTSASEEAVDVDYTTVLDEHTLGNWVKRVGQAELVALDTETNSLNAHQARLVGLSLSCETGKAAYIPLGHDYDGAPEQLSQTTVLEALRDWLEDEQAAKVGQHIKFDANVLKRHGITLAGVKHDTMLQSYIIDSTQRHDMDSLSRRLLGVDPVSFEAIAGKGSKQKTFNQIELDTAAHYAAEDADITLRLHQKQWPTLEKTDALCHVYQSLEVPLIGVLTAMEQRGVKVDADVLAEQSKALEAGMQEAQQKAFELAGHEFNLGSTKQLQQVLFEEMGITPLRKTPKGAPSTAEDVLQELALDHELPACIIEYRGLSKLKSTYTDRLPEQINPDTGRVHTSYHQAVTATGRLSSSDPNLQNIPIRKPEGRRIRKAFIAPEGYKLLASDYSQIELRIMAHLSGDDSLVNAMREGIDIHRATAAEVFDVALDQVSDDQRRAAKAINFGLIYGMSAFGLARQINEPRQQAQNYIDRYFERYPGVHDYMERTRKQAKDKGYVETISGRRLYLPEIHSRQRGRAQAAERAAINAPMQGSAADIIKRAMIDVHHWLQQEHEDSWLVMQVHDELVLEVPEHKLEEVQQGVDRIMASAADLAVPLVIEHGSGDNWDEAH